MGVIEGRMRAIDERERVELERLGESIAAISAEIDAMTRRMLGELREFDRRQGWALSGALSCAQWLSWRTGLAPHAARERVRYRSLRLKREQTDRARRLARKAQEKSGQPIPDSKKAVILAAVERAKARRAGIAPRNTDNLPPQVPPEIAAIDARRAAAKKR